MIKNYLKVALRNIKGHKTYSVINILGLSVGMACCFLIFLYVQHEFSYDRFHEKSNRIYRVITEWEIEGQRQIHNTTAAPVAPALLDEFPEVKNAVRMRRTQSIIYHGERSFVESHVYLVDPSFLEIFTFPLIRGNPETVLNDPSSMVITEYIAEKYFGHEDPIGKTLTFGKRFDFTVTGIAKDPPLNSHIRFDFLVRFDIINNLANFDYLGSWGAWNFSTYILLTQDYPLSTFEKKSAGLIKKYRGEDSTNPQMLHLQPLTNINLETNNLVQYLYFFSAIAAIILILACINFTNLSIAQSSTRAKEVGMRKVIGAGRHQLIKQFLGESLVLSFIALPLALILMVLFLPFFNSLFMTQLQSNYLQNLPFLFAIIGITMLVGTISGSYPAFYVSALKPVQSLKGESKSGANISLFRRLLVIFQFAVSIIFIIGTIVIYKQMSYIHNKNLGFNKEQIIQVPIYEREIKQRVDYVKAELLKNPDILSASVSSFFPGSFPNQSVRWEGQKEDEELMMAWYSVDHDFIKTFQIEILDGRDLSKEFQSDIQSAYILNESAVKAFGWDHPIGKRFQVEKADLSMGTVVGVMKNFHFASLHDEIKPLALLIDPDGFNYFSLRIAPHNVDRTLAYIEEKFKEFAPHTPFEYNFLDSEIDEMYVMEGRLGKLINTLSFLAIFIACLGLLGLSSFTIVQRTKEIGIRKILGASVPDLLTLLFKDFTRLVAIANIIAWPIGYFAMSKWLQNFAYRSQLSVWVFIAAGAITLIIALATISFQSIKAAAANPVDSLRYE